MTKEEIKAIADLVTANTIICTKEMLTSNEAARYMGVSMSYLYRLTMTGEIPHYKPTGRSMFFNRKEIEQWLQRNRINSIAEEKAEAALYCASNRQGV